jgi:hypothetical protein
VLECSPLVQILSPDIVSHVTRRWNELDGLQSEKRSHRQKFASPLPADDDTDIRGSRDDKVLRSFKRADDFGQYSAGRARGKAKLDCKLIEVKWFSILQRFQDPSRQGLQGTGCEDPHVKLCIDEAIDQQKKLELAPAGDAIQAGDHVTMVG